jgi:hypothetical protein
LIHGVLVGSWLRVFHFHVAKVVDHFLTLISLLTVTLFASPLSSLRSFLLSSLPTTTLATLAVLNMGPSRRFYRPESLTKADINL